ncbi:MAG: YihY/virulence factor BrkB family protein [Acidimicrobiia bacterium]|nr:YihY/virulence factor BrkB family protein [Acidimicrobiia bacterium]
MVGNLQIAKLAVRKFLDDKVPRLGAALAYYTVFALAPLVIVAVAIAGLAVSEDALQGEIVDQIDQTVGEDAAIFIQELIARSQEGGAGWGVGVGFVLALVGASALVIQLKGALNVVWDVPVSKTRGLLNAAKARGTALVSLALIGALLIALQFVASFVSGLDHVLADNTRFLDPLLQLLTPLLTVILSAIGFAAMFRFLPDTVVSWREASAGGLVAAIAYTVGSWALGFYIGNGGVGSTFGASATLVVLLVFIYYSAQIVLFGAEFARVYGLERQATAPVTSTSVVDATSDEPARPRISAPGAFLVGAVMGWWWRRD